MLSALEQYDRLRSVEFGCPFRVGRSGAVHTDTEAPMVPSVWHDEDEDVIVEGDRRWEVFSRGYTGQYGYRGAVMHPSEYLSGRLADDILTGPGVYALAVVEVLPDDEDPEPEPAGWCVLRLAEES